MTDWIKRDYVVLDFSTINELESCSERGFVHFTKSCIIEVAAVKIKGGEIVGHFHSFVAVDGYDAKKFDLGCFKPNARGITNLHLIGAPKFESVCEKLKDFTENCTLAVASLSQSPYDDFTNFKERALGCGFVFNQPVIEINDLLFALDFRNRIGDKSFNPNEMTLPEIAASLKRKKIWKEMLEERGIYLFDDEVFACRGGPLTYALAIAQLLISIFVEEEEWEQENLKNQAHEELEKWREDRAASKEDTKNIAIDEDLPF